MQEEEKKDELLKEVLAGFAGGILLAALVLFLCSFTAYPSVRSLSYWMIAAAGSFLPSFLNILKSGMQVKRAKLIMGIVGLLVCVFYSLSVTNDSASRNAVLSCTCVPCVCALIVQVLLNMHDRKRKEDCA